MNALNRRVSEALKDQSAALAAQMVAREFGRHPELEQRYGKIGRQKCLQDAGYHLAYLAQAIAADSTELFIDYIGAAKFMLAQRGIPASDLANLIETMKASLEQALPAELNQLACGYLDMGLAQLPRLPEDHPSYIVEGAPLATLANEYLQALLEGERQVACKLVLDAVQQGTAVRDVYLLVFERTQYEVGRLWQANQINVAQEHYCSAATQFIMSQLYPHIFGSVKTRGTLVGTCVSGDMHEIGVRIVCDFFEMQGWHSHYLGANVPSPSVIQTVLQLKADVLAISATITYHVDAVEKLIAALRSTPECRNVKVLVGGYPFKVAPTLWRTIGADGSANDAEGAVVEANRLTGQSLSA